MVLLFFAFLLLPFAQSWKMPDTMIGRRKFVEGFGLGPAPFPDFKDMNFELFGDAYLQDDSVKVTDSVQHQKGAIWSKLSYDVTKTRDFQLDFSFRVGGVDGKWFGDGFALWFVDPPFRGAGGDALGGPNRWRGLGLFFDTFNNQQLKGKKYPYIYGFMNDADTSYEDIGNTEVGDNGCHVPLRALEDGVLETTNARMTYRNNKLSVLMQPYDADDWLQCFQMEDVTLPDEFYIGVTAMTGEVVDKHSMIGIKLYNKLSIDPYKHGIENSAGSMPQLWQDIKHSGAVAREFEAWEKEIEEEVDDFSLNDRYADYYYGVNEALAADNYLTDAYDDASDYYAAQEQIKYEKPSIKNNYRKDVQKKKNQKPKSTVQLSDEEIAMIDEMISGTSIAKEIQELNDNRRKRIRKLRKHLEAEFSDAMDKVNDMIKDLRVKEYKMSRRIDALANKYNLKLLRAFKQVEKSSSGWFYPFLVVFIVVAIGTGLGYGKYRQHMKTHLL